MSYPHTPPLLSFHRWVKERGRGLVVEGDRTCTVGREGDVDLVVQYNTELRRKTWEAFFFSFFFSTFSS